MFLDLKSMSFGAMAYRDHFGNFEESFWALKPRNFQTASYMTRMYSKMPFYTLSVLLVFLNCNYKGH